MSKDKTPKLNPPSSKAAVVLESEEEKSLNEYDQNLADACEAARLVGMAQAGKVFATLAGQFCVTAFAALKKNKSYKLIKLQDRTGQLVTPNNEEMLCRLMWDISAHRANELLREYNVLGEELHGLIRTTNLPKRAMTALSRLSDEDRTPIEKLIYEHPDEPEFIADVVTAELNKVSADKDKLKAERDEAREDAAAKDRVIEDEKARVTELQIAEERRKGLPRIAQLTDARKEISLSTLSVMTSVQGLREGIRMMREIGGNQLSFSQLCKTRLFEVYDQLDDLITEFGFPAYQSNILESLLARADSVGRAVDDAIDGGATDTSDHSTTSNIVQLQPSETSHGAKK